MTRYRLMIFQRPAAPWRSSRELAERDAIKARLASRDHHSKTVYLTVPAWIARDDNLQVVR